MAGRQDPEQTFNNNVRELIGVMKKLAEGRKDTAELLVLESKYRIATKMDDRLLLDIIIDQQFFDTYHEQIMNRDQDFFLNTDFADNLRTYERTAKYAKDSYKEWLSIIDILRRVWTSVDDKTRDDLWRRVEDIYMSYLKYVESSKKE